MAKTFTVELTEREIDLINDAMSALEPVDGNGESDTEVEEELDFISHKFDLAKAKAGVLI